VSVGGSLTQPDEDGFTPMFTAVCTDYTPMVTALLALGVTRPPYI
jgi:hypothetical protein